MTPSKSAGAAPRTRADAVYARIRADIFAAKLTPGQRLKFPDLCATYDTSVGVAREVLARLAAERLVKAQAHQGYTVAALSVEELTDLTTARVELESLTFRRAMLDGGDQWESRVLASHHLLSRRQNACDRAGGELDEAWFQAHEDFHYALLSGCSSNRLLETTKALRAEAELYRRWSGPLGSHEERDLASEHQGLADAALAHDIDLGVALLRDHIAHTTQVLLTGVDACESVASDA